MAEVGIDLAGEMTKGVNRFLNDAFDYVITVCDQANETCPVFLGSVRHQMHFGFEDPVQVSGSEEEVIREFRRIRDEIKSKLHHLYQQLIRKEISI